MIVDDEFYFREALKISIPWEQLGYEICGEAKNGKDALGKIEELKPDVALVDINMPIMDGLEFSRDIKERGLNIKIIILTGYSEFNYAKQAVQLGVKNYILKPIDENELVNALLQIKEVIESEKNIKIETEKLREKVKDSLPILKDKLLNNLIQENSIINIEKVVSEFEYLDIIILSEYYQVATIELDSEDNLYYIIEARELFEFAVSNIVSEVLKDSFSLEVFNDNSQRICVIVGYNKNEDYLQLNLETKLEEIRELVKQYLKTTITIGVGNLKCYMHDISVSYKESLVALKNRAILGNDKVILYTSVSQNRVTTNVYSLENRTQLLMDMRMANVKHASELITKIFQEARIRNINHQMLDVICIEMISTCFEFSAETRHNFIDIFGDNHINILEMLQSQETIEEIQNLIKDIFVSVINYVEKNKNSKSSKIVVKVKSYIYQRYMDDSLNINELSKHLYINYGHLCYLFKKETKFTINEYITEYRLKKAKEYFDLGNQLVLDVANKVGYADANYFGKCFKKYYGISPSNYIENIQEK